MEGLKETTDVTSANLYWRGRWPAQLGRASAASQDGSEPRQVPASRLLAHPPRKGVRSAACPLQQLRRAPDRGARAAHNLERRRLAPLSPLRGGEDVRRGVRASSLAARCSPHHRPRSYTEAVEKLFQASVLHALPEKYESIVKQIDDGDDENRAFDMSACC